MRKRYFVLLWLGLFFTGIGIAIVDVQSVFFPVCIQLYFASFGLINLRYSFRSRKNPEKAHNPEIFWNEVLVGVLFFVLSGIYPLIFRRGGFPPSIHFHMWDSLTIHLLCWMIYTYFAQRNNKKHGRELSYQEWFFLYNQYQFTLNESKADLKRKFLHVGPPFVMVLVFFLGPLIEPVLLPFGWNAHSFMVYAWVALGVHFLWTINIAELLRLTKFSSLGRFATRWFESSYRPQELHTFSSGPIILLSWLVFSFAPIQVFFSVALIATVSDAAASVVGKKWGSKTRFHPTKTLAGFLAGFLVTYLIINLVYFSIPIASLSVWSIQLIALAAAGSFLLVDLFSHKISDNFGNPLATGCVQWIILICMANL
jgi:dolichol kinase